MAVHISVCTLLFIILQVATGSLESVRPMGVELLDTILDKVIFRPDICNNMVKNAPYKKCQEVECCWELAWAFLHMLLTSSFAYLTPRGHPNSSS
jgi:hypothetical protein